METIISSTTKEVRIGDHLPTVLIGERINPAGKKEMAEALKAGNLDIIRQEAIKQVRDGADVLDVCVGSFGVNEAAVLPEVVHEIMKLVNVPLCIDSPDILALEAALDVYQGKPLINSVTGEERSLSEILPLVKKYGTAVIGLTQDKEGIPYSWEQRTAIARKIVERAEDIGIPREDIIIDCLALAVGADPTASLTTMETIHHVRSELGVNITLGASNVSFGLPDRHLLNNAFVSITIAAGATCLIADASVVKPTVLAIDLLLGRDKRARRYINAYRDRLKNE